ncbi:MAG: putative signal transducing protein [Euzebya sp.]
MADFQSLTSLPHVHAAIVRGALEAEGITVLLDGADTTNAYGLFAGSWSVTLLVPADQLASAKALLAQIEASDITPDQAG